MKVHTGGDVAIPLSSSVTLGLGKLDLTNFCLPSNIFH